MHEPVVSTTFIRSSSAADVEGVGATAGVAPTPCRQICGVRLFTLSDVARKKAGEPGAPGDAIGVTHTVCENGRRCLSSAPTRKKNRRQRLGVRWRRR